MAKKAKVKLASAKSAAAPFNDTVNPAASPMSGSVQTGQIGPDLIGANIGMGQQISGMEQAKMMDNMRKKVKADPSVGNNIYDKSIGGYGKANPGETGTAAIARIRKKKVKVKKAM